MKFWLYFILSILNLLIPAKAGLYIRDEENLGYARMDIYSINGTFVTNLEIGSNNQPVTLGISSSLGDMIVMLPNVTCGNVYQTYQTYQWYNNLNITESTETLDSTDVDDNSNCTQYSVFDPYKSTSFYQQPAKRYFVYADPNDETFSFAGFWGKDNVKFGDNFSVSNLTMGVAFALNSVMGVLGLGPKWLELQSLAGQKEYSNLPIALIEQNITQRNLYSIFMNTKEAINGTILFGAIDSSKFDFLETKRIDTHLASQWVFGLSTHGISLINNQTRELTKLYAKSLPVILDFNQPYSELPANTLKQLVTEMGGIYNSSADFQEVSCDSSEYSVTYLLFNFGVETNEIPITLSDLVVSQDDKCYLNIATSNEGFTVATFGINILKELYLVYDLERFEISIGLRIFDESLPENISVITKQMSKGPLDSELERAASIANGGLYSSTTFAFVLPVLISLLFW